ncbi:MAG: bifunctional isocitrate dehydrogenase kinase/phosphatase [Anaerolineales bacterium]|nr:bifunctional isocitrate dehydrogenase kinase/phosphatase [Anaerolineales bacterium]MCA9929935.1 bifunctional isocitrate dehydrogenase kinase/phosphatase [Anaerolineales bacterium]
MPEKTYQLTDSRLANLGARTIHDAFQQYRMAFTAVTRRAKNRFEMCDWPGSRADALERLELYRLHVDQIVADIQALLAERLEQKLVWASMKAVYSGLITFHDDWEIAETFFNSVTRRIFTTVGVDPQIEFVSTDFETPPTHSNKSVYRVYGMSGETIPLIQQILADYQFEVPFADLSRDIMMMTTEISRKLKDIGALRIIERIEMVSSVFYRGMAAYLVGSLYSGSHRIPIVFALLNTEAGIVVDKLLLEEDLVSILFSFARSYFHVEVERPYDLVQFLKKIMPRKRTAELYISIGYNKHGKTELYRDLLQHLHTTDEQFQIARGQKGMVMTVFTMPDYDMVFKIIKDQFAKPKNTTRAHVKAKYDLVFKHDRAGRLIDAQSFEHLQFARQQFSPELLEELTSLAGDTVCIQGNYVTIEHTYIERRVIPLDIYIREAHEEDAAAALLDYGQTIKDLAVTNIFPGDMLLKNFGVTRHGRVVFYDYDELCLLTECKFRKIPAALSYEDELSDQPWFHVGKDDVFPEEFYHFLSVSNTLAAIFRQHHGDLFEVDFWKSMQAKMQNGDLIHIFPYPRQPHD